MIEPSRSDRPAYCQQEDLPLWRLLDLAKAKYDILAHRELANLDTAVEAGELIDRIKKKCLAEGKKYLKDLKKVGVSQQRASLYRRIYAKQGDWRPAEEELDLTSIQAVAKYLKKPEEEAVQEFVHQSTPGRTPVETCTPTPDLEEVEKPEEEYTPAPLPAKSEELSGVKEEPKKPRKGPARTRGEITLQTAKQRHEEILKQLPHSLGQVRLEVDELLDWFENSFERFEKRLKKLERDSAG